MKRPWLFVTLPLLGSGLIATLFAALGADVAPTLLNAENVAVFGMASGGAALAARSFSRGDYLRVVWVLLALSMGLLCLDALIFGALRASLPRPSTPAEALGSGALTMVANVTAVIGLIWVSRVWRLAELDLNVSRRTYWGSMAMVVVFASAMLGRDIFDWARQISQGQFGALPSLASALGDVAFSAMLVPMFLTALSLRGGALAWPWGLLTVSTFLWLAFDATHAVAVAFDLGTQAMLPFEEAFRAGALFFQLSASMAQREVMKV